MPSAPLSRLHHPREAVRQFTPNWFTATMGTGILALALDQFPYRVAGLAPLARGLWLADCVVFVVFALLYAARWLFFFDGARRILQHGVMCMFLGAIPMALATLLNGLLKFGPPFWGDAVLPLASTLWWVDVVLALGCAWGVPWLMFTRQEHHLQDMTAVWLLPIVAAEVAAVSGGLLVAHLAPGAQASTVLFMSYALWGTSVLPALGVLVILFLRMVLHKLPGPDMAASSWLALGPIGTGALGLLVLGEQAQRLYAATPMAGLGVAAHGAGLVGALALWGDGLWWLALAILITLRHVRAGLPFNLGWWAFTFPIGVLALATLALARTTGVGLFQVLGAAFVVLLALLWLVVAARTLHGAYHGHLFVAPCLRDAGAAAVAVA